MANLWFKFYGGEYLGDPKILQLNASERSCWITLLSLASQSENGSIKFLSETQLLLMSGVVEPKIDVLKKFEDLDMIRICNGTVTILNWEKRQYSEGYSRVKKFRERKSNTEDNDRIEENRIEEKREEKNAEVSSAGDSSLIVEIIKAFEEINSSASKFYANKTQRSAAASLAKTHGLEKVKNVIQNVLPKTNKLPFFPTITTPLQLQDKWSALEAAIFKERKKKSDTAPPVVFSPST